MPPSPENGRPSFASSSTLKGRRADKGSRLEHGSVSCCAAHFTYYTLCYLVTHKACAINNMQRIPQPLRSSRLKRAIDSIDYFLVAVDLRLELVVGTDGYSTAPPQARIAPSIGERRTRETACGSRMDLPCLGRNGREG